jgi:HSP20 family protein
MSSHDAPSNGIGARFCSVLDASELTGIKNGAARRCGLIWIKACRRETMSNGPSKRDLSAAGGGRERMSLKRRLTMALVRYEPFDLLSRLSDRLSRVQGGGWPLFGGEEDSNVVTSSWMPAVDIKEEDNRFLITADVPGVDPKNIEVTMENGVLTIKGERKQESEEERAGYRRIERSRGSFYRRFTMPDTADSDKIGARTRDGVLEIDIPKREAVKPRRIAIKS